MRVRRSGYPVVFLTAALLGVCAFSGTARADHERHERRDHHERHDRYEHDDRRGRHDNYYYDVRYYYYGDDDDDGFCPPGLARKHNGCVPPGHHHHKHKKKYRVGHCLDEHVEYRPVPHHILTRLEPVPRGYRYVQVDDDILLMAEAGKLVIDAITLISATGY